MARGNNDDNTNFFRLSSNMGITDYPMSVSVWHYPLATANIEIVFTFAESTATFNHLFLIKGSSDTLIAEVNSEGAGQDEEAITSNAFNIDAWNHSAGIFASSTDRAAYLNGDIGNGGFNTVDHAMPSTNVDRTSWGKRDDSNGGRPIDGRIAEAALWNVALSTNEVIALAAGVPPSRIRPGDLLGYWPLFGVGADEPDYSGNGRTQIEQGTMTLGNHSPTQAPFGGFTSSLFGAVAPQVFTNLRGRQIHGGAPHGA